MSGLKVNTDKTKIIWIGKKRYSKDKVEGVADLAWGTTEFNLLGIEFSVDLEKIIELNYNLAYTKTIKTLTRWKHRYLTPIGKITVLKTLIIPKFNHLFISIPNPRKTFLKDLNSTLYKFIWDGKPDKICRKQITKEYSQGGLKMLNLDYFIKALKITWLRRLQKHQQACWSRLVPFNETELDKIFLFGSQWSSHIANQINNRFWQDVLNAWCELIDNCLSSDKFCKGICGPLWYNPVISDDPLFIPQLYSRGVLSPVDIVNQNGEIYSREYINTCFNVSINFLDYYRLQTCRKKYLHFCKFDSDLLKRPFYHSHARLLGQSNKGCQVFYKILNSTNFQNKNYKQSWERDLQVQLDEQAWKEIHKVCFKCLPDHHLIWFQYKIIHKLLGVRQYLYKIKKSENPICNFCSDDNESIVHLFVLCKKTE